MSPGSVHSESGLCQHYLTPPTHQRDVAPSDPTEGRQARSAFSARRRPRKSSSVILCHDGEAGEGGGELAETVRKSPLVATCPPMSTSVSGAPGRTRTCNLRLRRPLLSPVELQAPRLASFVRRRVTIERCDIIVKNALRREVFRHEDPHSRRVARPRAVAWPCAQSDTARPRNSAWPCHPARVRQEFLAHRKTMSFRASEESRGISLWPLLSSKPHGETPRLRSG